MKCQPFPSSGQLQPGVCYSFGPHAASWWTPAHIAALCVLAAIACALAAYRRIVRELAYAVAHRDDPTSAMCPPVRWDGEQWNPDGHQVTAREWLALPRWERRHRADEFSAAAEALALNSEAEELAGIDEETETYHVLNGRVNDLWGTVPWWVRW